MATITKKKLAELEAIVAERKAKRDVAEGHLREAEGEYYDAQREFRRNEKLTPSMFIALAALAQPEARMVDCDYFNRSGRHGYWIEVQGHCVLVIRSSVYYGLRNREAVGDEKRDGVSKRVCQINDHGREILAKHSPVTVQGKATQVTPSQAMTG